jgi:hypothetical protein
MAKLRPKQIEGFEVTNIDAFNDGTQIVASETTFPSTAAVQNEFIPEQSLLIEKFTGLVVNSLTQPWSLTLSKAVQNDDTSLVTVFVNGVKLMDDVTLGASANLVTMSTLDYNIEASDIIEVHYVESHSI